MASPTTFITPELTALSSYTPAASAHVVKIEWMSPGHVDVVIDTVPSRAIRVHCELTPDGWIDAGDVVE